MAIIAPFKGLRYNTDKAGEISTLVCPPYDIISDEERKNYLEVNPHNIIRLELPKGGDPYKTAGNTLNEWLRDEILKKDEKEGIYVYEMAFLSHGERKNVKGIICLVGLEELSKGIILPHEETLSKAKTDRFNLMSSTYCNFSQVYSLYNDKDNSTFSIIDKVSSGDPDIKLTDDEGVEHRLWCIYDVDEIARISSKFEDKKLYIADGHHRYETALAFSKHLREQGIVSGEKGEAPSDYVCMMLVNMENDGLVVWPTHRIIRDLDNFNIGNVLNNDEVLRNFDIVKVDTLEQARDMLEENYNNEYKSYVLYTGSNFYVFTLRDKSVMKTLFPDASDAYCELDVSILHSLILERAFGIDKENMANQINLTYTRSEDEAIAEVREGRANCCFLLNPTRVSEISDVAAAGEKMPQKSTYFYPKLITGLVMNKFL